MYTIVKKDNTALWISVGVLSLALGSSLYYYYLKKKEWEKKNKEAEEELKRYLQSKIRFKEEDFIFMSDIIDTCRKTQEKEDVNKCMYSYLQTYINQVKKNTPIENWEKQDIKNFIEFLESKGLGQYAIEYKVYLDDDEK